METTPYRISTITAIASVGAPLRLAILLPLIALSTETEASTNADGGVLGAEFVDCQGARHARGIVREKKKDVAAARRAAAEQKRAAVAERRAASRRRKAEKRAGRCSEEQAAPAESCPDGQEEVQEEQPSPPRGTERRGRRKCFENQITLVLRLPVAVRAESAERRSQQPKQPQAIPAVQGVRATQPTSDVNIKVFQNGKLQMTGIKSVEQGERAVERVVALLREAALRAPDDASFTDDPSALRAGDFRVCLINSDFKMGWQVDRGKLHSMLCSRFRVCSVYEPCIYPGVKVQFEWNAAASRGAAGTCGLRLEDQGACRCCVRCSGKGTGAREGDCRRITIAVFRSGCLIVTGAHSTAQLDHAYAFIRGVLESERDTLGYCVGA